ncbi:MAG: tryptophan synthase subunit alpha [Planctomycetota bacterium]|nr:tryptophan synthase subunit alpha [Planctomycetota bacterium]
MSRYKTMFASLREKKQGAFIPFVMLGDPDETSSLEILHSFVEGGADALELGIPFSDPVADGPTIQAAALRALSNGMTPKKAFEILRKFRETNSITPIGLLVYANLVVQGENDAFFEQAKAAGVDSVLVADIPSKEAAPFCESAKKSGIDPVLIAAPNSSDDQLKMIAELSSGYTYVVSRAGVTGAETKAEMKHGQLIEKLKDFGAPPPVLGFGISSPEQVREALESGAVGAISGSAIVKLIASTAPEKRNETILQFIRGMKAETQLS